jgi:hypothetical protein
LGNPCLWSRTASSICAPRNCWHLENR